MESKADTIRDRYGDCPNGWEDIKKHAPWYKDRPEHNERGVIDAILDTQCLCYNCNTIYADGEHTMCWANRKMKTPEDVGCKDWLIAGFFITDMLEKFDKKK